MDLLEEYNELLDHALKASDSALLQAFGEEVSQSELGVSPADPEELIRYAKEKIQTLRHQIGDKLCDPEFLSKLEGLDKTDEKNAVIQMAQLILSSTGLPAALYVSVLLLRIGLRQWCSKDKQND